MQDTPWRSDTLVNGGAQVENALKNLACSSFFTVLLLRLFFVQEQKKYELIYKYADLSLSLGRYPKEKWITRLRPYYFLCKTVFQGFSTLMIFNKGHKNGGKFK